MFFSTPYNTSVKKVRYKKIVVKVIMTIIVFIIVKMIVHILLAIDVNLLGYEKMFGNDKDKIRNLRKLVAPYVIFTICVCSYYLYFSSFPFRS